MKHLTIAIAIALAPVLAYAQKSDTKKSSKNNTSATKPVAEQASLASRSEPIPEEPAAKKLEEARAKRIEEMLPNTRALVFVDSLVTDKDNFLSLLRLPTEAGHYVAPEQFTVASSQSLARIGSAAFVSNVGNTVYYSTPDTLGNLHISVAYKTPTEWTEPLPLDELYGFDHQDYPFLQSDGATLYFAATGPESIGGLDLFVTRYNEDNHQFVRPQNLGFPYNSSANDYLLAIDEEVGIGALVTDRRQPDDKVCIYWFIAEERRNIYDYDPEDKEAEEIVRRFADISSIVDTQEDHEDAISALRQAWEAALAAQTAATEEQQRFVISDRTVYTSLTHFLDAEARAIAQQWLEADARLRNMEQQLEQQRQSYALDRKAETASALQQLEIDLLQQRAHAKRLEKAYRAAEQQVPF